MQMLGIETEFAVFIHAVLNGIFVTSVYLSLRVLRRLAGHALWVIQLEDGAYWVFTALYLFVQVYHTSDGSVRWYFVLGVVFGMILMRSLMQLAKKVDQKIYIFIRKKFGKSIDKSS